MKKLISTFLLLFAVLTVKAQSVVSGKVTDQQGQPLAYVSVSAEGSEVHTVTNDDGQFTLKTTHKPRYVRLSHIGYKSRKIAIDEGTELPLHIRMVSNTVELREVLVNANNPMAILRAAMERECRIIPTNLNWYVVSIAKRPVVVPVLSL